MVEGSFDQVVLFPSPPLCHHQLRLPHCRVGLGEECHVKVVLEADVEEDGCKVDDVGEEGCKVDDVGEEGCKVDDVGEEGCKVDDVGEEGCKVDDVGEEGCKVDDVGEEGCKVDDVGEEGCKVDDVGEEGCKVDDAREEGCKVDDVGAGVVITTYGEDAESVDVWGSEATWTATSERSLDSVREEERIGLDMDQPNAESFFWDCCW